MITTEGFKDLMEIGWQKRPSLYDLLKPKPQPLIPEGMICEVRERILHDGSVLVPLNEDDVRKATEYLKAKKVSSIAVYYILFSQPYMSFVLKKSSKRFILKYMFLFQVNWYRSFVSSHV